MNTTLLRKYNIPGPRYTSYPAVPYWDNDTFSEAGWVESLQKSMTGTSESSPVEKGISLYIHLPFCESLCTFCGCNKRITRNHAVEGPYIDSLLKEWTLYRQLLTRRSASSLPKITELHLGGGTPSFFKPDSLRRLVSGLLEHTGSLSQVDYGWEGHPNNTSPEHLQTLFEFNFRRVSFGIQDYDPIVQRAIHRHQSFDQVKMVTDWAREIGYTSIAHDLVYGLPYQTADAITNTVEKTIALRPDRIAFYSYAHVPWLKGNGQRGYREENLPSGAQKRNLYEIGRTLLEANGYYEIGMDHFALPHDSLYKAMKEGRLHRNFMGYTSTRTNILLGLGASSIGDAGGAFAQNEKEVETYQKRISAGELPLLRGHLLSREDQSIRTYILNLLCRYETSWDPFDWTTTDWDQLEEKLEGFRLDGLIDYCESGIRVRTEGRPFLRNICMAFDKRLGTRSLKNVFSRTI